jgi:hypothetical protein
MSGFLIEVDTLSQSSRVSQSVQESEMYTEQIEANELNSAISKLSDYLSHRAANSGLSQTATIRVYSSTWSTQKEVLIKTATINLDPGLTVKGGKTAYRDYTGQVKRVFQGL